MVGLLISLHFFCITSRFPSTLLSLFICTEHALASESHKETCHGQQKHKISPYAKWLSQISTSVLSNLQRTAVLDSLFAEPGGKKGQKCESRRGKQISKVPQTPGRIRTAVPPLYPYSGISSIWEISQTFHFKDDQNTCTQRNI